jgi:hypothetical protein
MPVANFFPSPSSRSARACPLARPPARSSSSLSVLLWFALSAPVLVQNETSQVSLPFSLFLALLFPVSVFLAACFFFPPPSSNSCCRRATALPLSVSFRSRRLYNLCTLRASDGFFLSSVVIWGVFSVGLEKVNRYCSLLIALGNPAVCSRSKFLRSIGVFRPGFGSLSLMSFLLFAAVLCDIPVDVSSCFRIGWIG